MGSMCMEVANLKLTTEGFNFTLPLNSTTSTEGVVPVNLTTEKEAVEMTFHFCVYECKYLLHVSA